MRKVYRYQAIDRSLLTPYFKKWVVSPVASCLPPGISPNTITIASFICALGAFFYALVEGRESLASYGLVPLLIFLYLLGDHLDGMQAKRTGSSSALGEFCDHYLDVFVTGLMGAILCVMLPVKHPLLPLGYFFTVYMLHAATIFEQVRTGWLRFPPFGSVEGLFLSIALILLCGYRDFYAFLAKPIFAQLTGAEWILLSSCLLAAKDSCKILIKTRPSKEVVLFAAVLFGMCVLLTKAPIGVAAGITALYCGLFIGGLIRAHLLESSIKSPDPIPLIVLLLQSFLALKEASMLVNAALISYLGFKNLMLAYRTTKDLNPLDEAVPVEESIT